jgi:serine/threonine protein kinase
MCVLVNNEVHCGGAPTHGRPRISDHELLRPIGNGSYGTVWLAKNTVGTFRAIKVVYRNRFENAKPYEREYAGLKLFEPISRGHEGFVDILHLGRNEAEGYFYYIMEVADSESNPPQENSDSGMTPQPRPGTRIHSSTAEATSTGAPAATLPVACAPQASNPPVPRKAPAVPQVDPEMYRPRTLAVEIRKRGRLAVAECVEISCVLTDALAYLHEANLVHRDLKPDNIIFVGGVPKIADIGTVTQAGQGQMAMGSLGFMPHEGPGTVQADLYSLGKIIYEMSMGKDAQAFPSPPADLADIPERKDLMELNEIITRACDPDVRRRYQNAQELKRELDMLRRGEKVSGWRRHRQLVTTLKTAGIGACLLLGVAVGARYCGMPHTRWELTEIAHLAVPGVQNWQYAKVGDLDEDGKPDFFVTTTNELTVAWGSGVKGKWQAPGSSVNALEVHLVPGLYRGGANGLLLSWQENETNISITVLNRALTETNSKRFEGIVKFRSDFDSVQVTDLRRNAAAQVLAIVGTANTNAPRGLWCFDFDSSKLAWRFNTAPYPRALLFEDLSRTGTNDMIFGSHAVCNGTRLSDGTDDSHSYLYAVSGAGERLWREEVGGEYSICTPTVADLSGNGTYEVIVLLKVCQDLREKDTGKIFKYDLQGQMLNSYDSGTELLSMMIGDLGTDGKQQILATDRRGYLHVLNPDLSLASTNEVVRQRYHGKYDRVELILDAITDLNADGRKELVFHSVQLEYGATVVGPKQPPKCIYEDTCVLVLDKDLNLLAEHTLAPSYSKYVGWTVLATDLDRNGRKGLVVLGPDARVFKMVAVK